MSNLTDHAEYEMNRVGLFDADADYGGAHAKAVMELIETFARQGHSGTSAALTLALFHELAQFKPLSQITSDPEEWDDVSGISGYPMWQNRRRSTSFSRDGGKSWYDIEDETLHTALGTPQVPVIPEGWRLEIMGYNEGKGRFEAEILQIDAGKIAVGFAPKWIDSLIDAIAAAKEAGE